MTAGVVSEIQNFEPTQKAVEPSLGARLRALRVGRGWTVEAVADRAGISKSGLSKIENDKTSPTYEVLLKIVAAYGMDMAAIFPAEPPMQGVIVTRLEDEQPFRSRNVFYKLHAAGFPDKRFTPLRCAVFPCAEADLEWNRHEGQEFVYVLLGQVELRTGPGQVHVLRAGDSAYLASDQPHAVRSLIEPSSEVLWIAAPD